MHSDVGHLAPRLGPPSPTAVVVAHPDDEALWLSSVLADADRVVFCFADPFRDPEKAAARRRALAGLPLAGISTLGIGESGARLCVDWAHPRPTPTGIEIADPEAGARYEANFKAVLEGLRPALAGFQSICTHNPWGEYGHAEHIQIHRAVAALQDELGFTLWFSNYVGKASWPLARRLAGEPCWSERRSLAPDLAIARRLKRVYRASGAWTWSIAHRWPARETLYAVPAAGDRRPRHALSGETLLDVAGLRWWPVPWHPVHRRLR